MVIWILTNFLQCCHSFGLLIWWDLIILNKNPGLTLLVCTTLKDYLIAFAFIIILFCTHPLPQTALSACVLAGTASGIKLLINSFLHVVQEFSLHRFYGLTLLKRVNPLSCEVPVWRHNAQCSLVALHYGWRMENRHFHLGAKLYRPCKYMHKRHALKHLLAVVTSALVEVGLFVLTFLCFCLAAPDIWDNASTCCGFRSSGGTLFGLLNGLICSKHCCLSASSFTWLMTFCIWLGNHTQLFRALCH